MSFQPMIDTLSIPPDTIMADTLSETLAKPIIGENPDDLGAFGEIPGFLVHQVTESWQFYFIILLLTGYIVARALLGPWSRNTFTAAVRFNAATSMFKDNSQLQRQQDAVLYGFYFVSGGFFITLISDHFSLFPFQLKGIELFGFFAALLLALFYLRIVVNNIIGHVFFSLQLFMEYLYHSFIFNKLIGILTIPLSITILYTTGILNSVVVWISLGIILLMLIMRIYRGAIFSAKNRVLNFYLFLYLCALEIVPLMLLYKWFSNVV